MNTKKYDLPVVFAPEMQFEARTNPSLPFRIIQDNQFEQLKSKLLAQQLADAAPELNAPLRHAANEAAALAWSTAIPLLAFPALFEEKTAVAIRHAERQARIFRNSRESVTV